MVTTKLNLSMTEPQVRQIYAKQGDTGRVLDITLDQTPEDGTLRILRPDGTEVTSEAVTGGEVSESGETVTFESMTEADVTELTVGIEPVQDLNGYDAPWVGGAGKNLYNASAINNLSSNGVTATVSNGTITLNGTATANAFFTVLDTGYANKQYTFSLNNPVANSGVRAVFRDANGNYHTDNQVNTVNKVITFTGEPNSISLYVTSGTTLSNFVVKPQLELGYTATAWQPYSNICPITGHDEVTVTRTGKNLCPTFTSGTGSGLTYTVNDDGSVHVTGTNTGTTFWAVQLTLPKGTYVLTGAPTNGQLTLRSERGGGAPSSAFSGKLDDYGNGATFTVSETASAWLNIRSTEGTHDKMYYPMIRLASETDDTYEPYQGSTYTTSLGQTVYGGTLDMASGVLTVDRAYTTIASANVSKVSGSQYASFQITPLRDLKSKNAGSEVLCVSSAYKGVSFNGASATDDNYLFASGGNIRIKDESRASLSVDDYKAQMGNVQIVYELATPITYQLTPIEVKTLLGTNNVWASSGDIVNITFTYGGLLSELPSEATEIVGKCYCDIEQNGVSSMPFTLNVKKNERES